MLDISVVHPFEACTGFAVRWLTLIAAYDLDGAEALVDLNESGGPLAESFPAPECFTYCHPDQVVNWTMHIMAAGQNGLSCHFEVPFGEREYRPMMARFHMRRVVDQLEVRFQGLVPT